MSEVKPLKEYGHIEKNKDTHFILTSSEWRGNVYVDMREYYQLPEDPGKWLPTKKGIRFKKEMLDAVLALLEKAKD